MLHLSSPLLCPPLLPSTLLYPLLLPSTLLSSPLPFFTGFCPSPHPSSLVLLGWRCEVAPATLLCPLSCGQQYTQQGTEGRRERGRGVGAQARAGRETEDGSAPPLHCSACHVRMRAG